MKRSRFAVAAWSGRRAQFVSRPAAVLLPLLLLLFLPACRAEENGVPDRESPLPTASPTAGEGDLATTPAPVCTPPACADGETYTCPGSCPNGCGIVCATVTPASTDGKTPMPMCTPPACAEGEVYFCPGDCPGGCGTTCATVTPALPAGDGTLFDGDRAMDFLEAQMDFGPRYPGSPGHQAVGDYIVQELEASGWEVEVQEIPYQGVTGRNLIARANSGEEEIIILGAHYDTRRIADQSRDPADRDSPVPGAVDGASGVAVLLELARTLDLEEIPAEIWLAFFDLEDNGGGGIEGWEWIVGSTYMAANLTVEPEAMVLVDMIGDAEQQLYYEGNSDPDLQARLWQIAAGLGYEEYFIPELRHTMIDDHLPFAQRGIPAVDIIDFDYPYWHTVEDTADKASAGSLLRVGRTIEEWLEQSLE